MKPEILLVEDNDLLQNVIPQLLKELGYYVSLATNGQEALEMFSFKYDLILLALHLPDIRGLDVFKAIRSIEEKLGLYTPIIALTTLGDLMEQDCIDAGFDDIVIKGSHQVLIDTLQRWLPTYTLENINGDEKC